MVDDAAMSMADGTGVDPDIATFVGRLNADYASHGDVVRSLAERRAVAERVRAPWRAGGPAMASSEDFTTGGVRLRLYRPSDTPDLPTMLYVHGGGWTLFSIDTHDRLMREYAARAGIAVLGIDYSLSPEAKFPLALDEIANALAWLDTQADTLGLDRRCLFIGGDSAGANLSVATCLRRRDAGQVPLAGMVLNYGAYAPEETDSYRRYAGPHHNLEVAEMHAFWADYVRGPEDLTNPLVAPLKADLRDLPPAVLAIAERDILADSNHEFARKLAAAGVPVEAHVYAGATHSFLEAVSIAAIAARAFDDQARWLRERVAERRMSAVAHA